MAERYVSSQRRAPTSRPGEKMMSGGKAACISFGIFWRTSSSPFSRFADPGRSIHPRSTPYVIACSYQCPCLLLNPFLLPKSRNSGGESKYLMVLQACKLLIFRDAKEVENGKIALNWNVSGTRTFQPADFACSTTARGARRGKAGTRASVPGKPRLSNL
jgi:hypothetical protein